MREKNKSMGFGRLHGANRPKRHAEYTRLYVSIGCYFVILLVAIGVLGNAQSFDIDANFANFQPRAMANEISNRNETDWCLILVNKYNPIPKGYKVELTELANGQSVDERIYPALQEMFDTARSEGIYPVVASGYRTAKKQQRLLDEKIDAYKAEG